MIYKEPEKPTRTKGDMILDVVLLLVAVGTAYMCVNLVGLV